MSWSRCLGATGQAVFIEYNSKQEVAVVLNSNWAWLLESDLFYQRVCQVPMTISLLHALITFLRLLEWPLTVRLHEALTASALVGLSMADSSGRFVATVTWLCPASSSHSLRGPADRGAIVISTWWWSLPLHISRSHVSAALELSSSEDCGDDCTDPRRLTEVSAAGRIEYLRKRIQHNTIIKVVNARTSYANILRIFRTLPLRLCDKTWRLS